MSEDLLRDKLERTMREHRCSRWTDGDGDALPLVDCLTPPGSVDITPGIDEIEQLADALAVAVEEHFASLPESENKSWHSVEEDGLPLHGKVVLAFWKPHDGKVHPGCYATAVYQRGKWMNPDDEDDFYADAAYWMYLPKPPESPHKPNCSHDYAPNAFTESGVRVNGRACLKCGALEPPPTCTEREKP